VHHDLAATGALSDLAGAGMEVVAGTAGAAAATVVACCATARLGSSVATSVTERNLVFM